MDVEKTVRSTQWAVRSTQCVTCVTASKEKGVAKW